ncbi:hypothetical protein HMN09_00162500 [Mycena chlorophos]|uniref:Uncharacterized protein n=1 Tax=Mycena chlorophos TaxID=658473 RepID=A0A8H6TKQ7_MYCCL|nr:hypothetical protein HMN09_00162500 [Mycena chlorophos]
MADSQPQFVTDIVFQRVLLDMAAEELKRCYGLTLDDVDFQPPQCFYRKGASMEDRMGPGLLPNIVSAAMEETANELFGPAPIPVPDLPEPAPGSAVARFLAGTLQDGPPGTPDAIDQVIGEVLGVSPFAVAEWYRTLPPALTVYDPGLDARSAAARRVEARKQRAFNPFAVQPAPATPVTSLSESLASSLVLSPPSEPLPAILAGVDPTVDSQSVTPAVMPQQTPRRKNPSRAAKDKKNKTPQPLRRRSSVHLPQASTSSASPTKRKSYRGWAMVNENGEDLDEAELEEFQIGLVTGTLGWNEKWLESQLRKKKSSSSGL